MQDVTSQATPSFNISKRIQPTKIFAIACLSFKKDTNIGLTKSLPERAQDNVVKYSKNQVQGLKFPQKMGQTDSKRKSRGIQRFSISIREKKSSTATICKYAINTLI